MKKLFYVSNDLQSAKCEGIFEHFTQLESQLANLKVEEHSKFGHFWKAHDQTNPTRYGTKCNTDTTKIPH